MPTVPQISKKKQKIVYWYIPSVLTIITVPLIRVSGPDSYTSVAFAVIVFSGFIFLFYTIASVVGFHAVDLLTAGWNGIRKRNSN
jgi:hypothetical protein